MRVCLLVLVAGWMVAVRVADATPYQVSPTSIDFGPIDIRGPAAVRTVTLTNTGTAGLDIGAVTHSGSAAFTYSAAPAIHLAAGASETVTVTYKPTLEEQDTASLVFPITSNPSVTVPLAGRGIDRHIMVTAPTFPDTYRNPGDTAPVRAVTIANTGEASLAVSSVSLTGGPVWQLLDPDPVDIPGGTSYDVRIRFAPATAGPAPMGQVTITDDDVAEPTIMIDLAGNGVLRKVQMGPPVIDLGYTGLGVPIRLSERLPDTPLAIANNDQASFSVQAITIDNPAFAVTTLDEKSTQQLALPVGQTVPLDITFVASTPGDYATTATLFLDQDPDAQATVLIKAHAEFIDAQGGGGCSAGGDAGLGVAIALMLLVRRKRWALVLAPAIASADPPRNLDISVFDPTPSTLGTGFQLVTPGIADQGVLVGTALLTYASHPLVLVTPQAEDVAIANRMTLDLGGAYAVNEHLELGAHMPLMIQNGDVVDPTMAAGTPAISGDARGNLNVHAKASFAPGIGALATVELPTASDDRFAGTGHTAVRVLAVSDVPIAPQLSATLDFGAALRSESTFANITERTGVLWGVGATYVVQRDLALTAELFGDLVPGGRRDAMGNASALATTEVLAGVHYRLDPLLSIGAAIGRGVIDGPGAPAFRGVLTLAYSPRWHEEPAPVHVAPPDQDTDHDGIPDVRDHCPNDPEDRDGFEDDDGCPDLDNDHDGVPDAQDRCPNQAGDGPDGCPILDTDHDGIPDSRDACPNEPETINGIADDDGCPDEGDPGVVLQPDHLELRTPLTFSGTAIADGANTLGQVGAQLRAHPEIVLLRIVVRAPDVEVAQKRADTLREWLVQWGVSAKRLEARGASGDEALDLLVVH